MFRADASPTLGVGHISRCLALADALYEKGWKCTFVVNRESNVTYPALSVSSHKVMVPQIPNDPLSVAQVVGGTADLLVVDHYNLDKKFESACRGWAESIMVVDDLADRPHDCDFLVDQSISRTISDYKFLTPISCRILVGPHYAMLRPEFSRIRQKSLERRNSSQIINRILVAIGGSDPHDVTTTAICALMHCYQNINIDVVLGKNSPNLNKVRNLIFSFRDKIKLHIDTQKMSELMLNADLAIGACGISSWERCTLGLPTIAITIAENQRENAQSLEKAGAILYSGEWTNISENSIVKNLKEIQKNPFLLEKMSLSSRKICNGKGISRIINSVLS